jgi:hypothetical protein
MQIILFYTLVLLNSDIILAGEKVVETREENYISHGFSENPSKALAKQESCNTAKRELIAFVFGAAFQLNQNMIRSLGAMDYSQDVSVNTGEIVLRSAMTETSVTDGVTECLITYPVQEANIEKDRLKSAQNKNIRFVDIGDPDNIKGGVLEIVTIPEDTDVLIDNVRWGTTPLRLNGKISAGIHTITLENQNYKTVEEKIEISNRKTRIEKILKRATGKLKMITDPEGALIKINEEELGHSPTNEIELLSGQKIKIEVTHPETETYVQYITLARDELKTINQKLPLKPGLISLNIVPNKEVLISFDGIVRPKLLPNSWIQLEAGTHDIAVSAKDYAETIISIDLRGGEKKAIPTMILVSLKEIEEKRLEKEKQEKIEQLATEEAQRQRDQNETELNRRNLVSNHFLLGMEGNFNTPKYKEEGFGIFLGIQKSFFYNYVGLQLLGSFGGEGDVEGNGDKDGNNKYQTISLGLPIYFGNFYLKPSYGIRFDQITKIKNVPISTSDGKISYETTSKAYITKTNRTFEYYGAGFIFPKNDEKSDASMYIEGGIYNSKSSRDPALQFGIRWNF